MRKPKISIIIPVYNARDTIRACLKSIVSQSYKNIEVIVIDDGSTDGTRDILKSIIGISVYFINHSGVSAARNVGIKSAKGDFIYFMDADDSFEDCFSLELLVRSANADLVLGGNHKTDKNSLICDYVSSPNRNTALAFVWDKLFKRSIIKKNDIFFKEAMRKHEDTEFVFRYIRYAYKLSCVGVKTHRRNFNKIGAGMDIFDARLERNMLMSSIYDFLGSSYYLDHCFVSLKIVEMVRAYRLPFLDHYVFIRNLVNERHYTIHWYDHVAGDSKIIPFLIKQRLYLLLTLVCRWKGKKRYG